MVFEVRQIEDDDELYRRIPPNYFKANGTISSSAYKLNGAPYDSIQTIVREQEVAEFSVFRMIQIGRKACPKLHQVRSVGMWQWLVIPHQNHS